MDGPKLQEREKNIYNVKWVLNNLENKTDITRSKMLTRKLIVSNLWRPKKIVNNINQKQAEKKTTEVKFKGAPREN